MKGMLCSPGSLMKIDRMYTALLTGESNPNLSIYIYPDVLVCWLGGRSFVVGGVKYKISQVCFTEQDWDEQPSDIVAWCALRDKTDFRPFNYFNLLNHGK